MESNRQRRVVKISLITKANTAMGICEKLREIYDEVVDMPHNEKITELLVDAFIMGKKMQDRLTYYKKTYNDKTGHNGRNIDRSKKRALAKYRFRRLRKI